MRFDTAEQTFSYIESFTNLERSPNLTAREYRLDRMYQLLELFGNPQHSFKSIHIAGSKGKGSTASFTAAVLKANGYKTGLYCSPHVQSYKERISAAGEFFEDALYAETASEMLEAIEKSKFSDHFIGGLPTTFELLTLLAFLIFKKTKCEWAVFETGLGGRLDATNVIIPEASVITIIELEHTEYLGNTIEAIAGEKAGIIKEGVPVFSAAQRPEAEHVFIERAARSGSEIFFFSELVKKLETIDEPQSNSAFLELYSGSSFKLKLQTMGRFQLSNASLALAVLDYLKNDKGTFHDGFDPSAGLDEVYLPGRMELFQRTAERPEIMLDGAHTVKSVSASLETFFSFESEPAVLLFGSVEGKDAAGMAELLCCRFQRVIITTPGTFKKSSPEAVFAIFKNACSALCDSELILEPDTDRAYNLAVGADLPVLVAGSFYLAAEIRKKIKNQ